MMGERPHSDWETLNGSVLPEPPIEQTETQHRPSLVEQEEQNFLRHAEQLGVHPEKIAEASVREALSFLRKHMRLQTALFEPGVKEVPVLAYAVTEEEMKKLIGPESYALGFSDGPIVIVRKELSEPLKKQILVHEAAHTGLGHRLYHDSQKVRERRYAAGGLAKEHLPSGAAHGAFLNEAIVEDLAWKFSEDTGDTTVRRDDMIRQAISGQRLEQAQPYIAAYALRELVNKSPRVGLAVEQLLAEGSTENMRTLVKEINAIHPELYGKLLKAQYGMGRRLQDGVDQFFDALEAVVNATSEGVYTKVQSKEEVNARAEQAKEAARQEGQMIARIKGKQIRFRVPQGLQSAGITFEKRGELSYRALLALGESKVSNADANTPDVFATSESLDFTTDAALNLAVYTTHTPELLARLPALKFLNITGTESTRHKLRLAPKEQLTHLLDQFSPLFERPTFEGMTVLVKDFAESKEQLQEIVQATSPHLQVVPAHHESVVRIVRA